MPNRFLLIGPIAVILLCALAAGSPALATGCRSSNATGGTLIDPITLEIALFTYDGVVAGSRSQEKFGNFLRMIDQKLINLEAIVKGKPNNREFEYLSEIRLVHRGEDTFPIHDEKAIGIWIRNEGIMLVMRGSLWSDDAVNYRVFSQFHLGALSEFLPRNVISVDLPIVGSELGNTRDSHTLVILYSLLIDARRSNCPTSVISRYLKVANDLIANLERRGAVVDDMPLIEEAFARAGKDLEGR